jgi:hypothetical protein
MPDVLWCMSLPRAIILQALLWHLAFSRPQHVAPADDTSCSPVNFDAICKVCYQ